MTYSLLLYALPAAIALTCKIYFLSRLSLSSVLSRAFVVLCVVMVMQNAMEVLGYLGLVYSETLARLSADFYMCFTYGLGTALLYFSCAVCRVYKPYFSYVLGGLTALLVIMHINGCIVTSYSNVGYAQIAVQGEYFYVFELYAAATIVLSMLLMLWDVVFCTNYDLKIRTLVVLVGLSPLALSSVLLLLIMHSGGNVSSAIILPVCTLLFLVSAAMATDKELLDKVSG